MIEIVSGNIFESPAECITDANNSIGVSGAGLALAFARRYPKTAEHYNKFSREWQAHHKVRSANGDDYEPILLHPVIYPKGNQDNSDYAICKFPTMVFPGELTKDENIVKNLIALRNLLPLKLINSIALPALGCGIGRYSFDQLEQNVRKIFDESAIDVYLYKPG
jgi:O-acetyl-ADP-ribose deacetylase (regulator of RNase III)